MHKYISQLGRTGVATLYDLILQCQMHAVASVYNLVWNKDLTREGKVPVL